MLMGSPGSLLRRAGFWIALVTFVLITIPHYAEALTYPAFLARTFDSLEMSRHVFERMLYLVPVSVAALSFGLYGGLGVSALVLAAMLPRAVLLSAHPPDAVLESSMVFAIGCTLSYSYAMLRKERGLRQKLETAERNMRGFLKQLTTAQEDERLRIAGELHDDTIQSMVVLTRGLDSLVAGRQDLPSEVREKLEDLWHQGNNVIMGLRRLSQNLRPAALNRLGLVSALEWLASEMAQRGGIEINTEVEGLEPRLPEEVEMALFRITQEALNNVHKHAAAQRVLIKITYRSDAVSLTVEDDGCGFDTASRTDDPTRLGKLGLIGMQERASLVGGRLGIVSKVGVGTRIDVTVPLHTAPDQPRAD